MLTYIKKLKLINDFYSHFTKKKNELLFRTVSVKSLVQIEKCVFHHNDFVYLEMLKFLMIFY